MKLLFLLHLDYMHINLVCYFLRLLREISGNSCTDFGGVCPLSSCSPKQFSDNLVLTTQKHPSLDKLCVGAPLFFPTESPRKEAPCSPSVASPKSGGGPLTEKKIFKRYESLGTHASFLQAVAETQRFYKFV